GWNGRPLVVIDNGNEGHIALTGSHRIAAAKEAGIEVPAIVLDNTEDTARLIDVDDDERERIAKELAEDGIIPQRAYDLLAQENDLNYANEPQFSRKTNAAQAEITARYQQTVSDILSGKKTVTDAVLMGYTPDIYQALGVPSLPFVIGPGHIYSIAKTEAEAKTDGKYNKRTHYHGLGDDAVKNLYEAAQNPIAVIAAKDVDAKATPMRSTHSVVAIIDVGTANKSRLVPIEITAERHMGNDMLDVNVVSSVYDRNVENLLAEAVAQENTGEIGVYYIKKEAVPLVSARVQFPEHLHKAIASDGIVHLVPEKVNMRIENQTQSRQFKRWFGDWQNDPKYARKVVNEDGTQKVVYHGTNENFTVFDASKGRANMDIQGMFFSPWEIEAGGYGENVRAFYLNIRKPASEAAA
ncbi:MAG: hypothetical protein IJG06_10480, partial [Clostridia bacterium]|nr:hypothetical protein [Clostridia bacterium]